MSEYVKKLFKSIGLEEIILCAVIILSYIALMLITKGAEAPPGGMSLSNITLLSFGFFLLSFAIAVVAVLAGVGGGVPFTALMLAFTPIDSLVIRGTALIVTMFSALMSTGPLTKTGLANMKISIYTVVGYGIGSFAGAQFAVRMAGRLGTTGEGIIRLVLAAIVVYVIFYFALGGSKLEWPRVKHVDRFTQWLGFTQPYYEESLDKVVNYQVTRAGWALLAMIGGGLISGFFGIGAGWVLVPTINLLMGAPLKVAAATSGVLMGMGNCVSVWPYILAGTIIPLFAAPWFVGQVLGGFVGGLLLIKVKAASVRLIAIGIFTFSFYGLVAKGLGILGYIPDLPGTTHIVVMLVIIVAVVFRMTVRSPHLKEGGKTRGKT